MSNTIKLKRGSGSDPSASDLEVGELAIRTDSGKIFTKKDNGSVAEISGSGGGNPLTDGDKGDITVSAGGDTFTIDNGVVTGAKLATNIDLVDNQKLRLGTGTDLQLYHDGSHSYIQDAGTGQLKVLSNQFRVHNAADTETMIAAFQEGAVKLMYDNSLKFETTSAGTKNTGVLDCTGSILLTDQSGDNIGKLRLGNGPDLEIYHSGSHSFIKNTTGTLQLENAGNITITKGGTENMARFIPDGAVELYHNNIKKLETYSDGIKVIGQEGTSAALQLVADDGDDNGDTWELRSNQDDNDLTFKNNISGSSVDKLTLQNDGDLFTTGDVYLKNDSKKLKFGASDDLQIYHSGTASFISNITACTLLLQNEGNIQFEAKSGEDSCKMIPHGGVELYYDNSKKFETTNTGATVTGTLVSDGLTIGDSDELRIGDSTDFSIYHSTDTTLSNITGDLKIYNVGTNSDDILVRAKDDIRLEVQSGDTAIACIGDGAVELYYDNSKKFETISSGIKVIGDTSTGTIIQGAFSLRDTTSSSDRIKWIPNSPYVLRWSDNFKASFGHGDDLQIYHDGSDSHIKNTFATGDLILDSAQNFYVKHSGEIQIQAVNDGAVNLYYDGNNKLSTADTGIDVTGAINSTVDSSNNTLKIETTTSGDPKLNFNAAGSGGHEIEYIRSSNTLNFKQGGGSVRMSIAADGTTTIAQNLIVGGNLTISGTTTTIDTTTLTVEDKNIELGKVSSPTDTTADGGGITLKGATDKTFNWIDSTDSWTSSEHIALPDNKKLQLGTGQDLQIYHDGSHSVIKNETGNLYAVSDTSIILQAATGGDVYFKGIKSGAVELYYSGSKKLETTSSGVTLSGSLNLTGYLLNLGDSSGTTDDRIRLGASADLQLYHDGSNSRIHNTTGELIFRTGSNYVFYNSDGSEKLAKFISDGAVELYYNGTKKLETTSAGAAIIGSFFLKDASANTEIYYDSTADSIIFKDNKKAAFGDSSDLQIYHNGTTSHIHDDTSSVLQITNNDIRFKTSADETTLRAVANGAVELMFNGNTKIATTNTGIDVTGIADVSSEITVGGNDTRFAENNLRFKSSGDAFIDHNTTGQDIKFRVSNSSSLDTTPVTIQSDGQVNIGGAQFYQSNNVAIPVDGARFKLGANDDFGIRHDANGPTIFDDANNQGVKFQFKELNITEYTGTNTKIKLDTNGNVAIGTSSIADDADHCKLVISGQSGTAAGILIFQDTSNNEDGAIFSDDGNLFIVADRANATSNSSIIFRVDGSSQKMSLDSSGNLDVTGNVVASGDITISSSLPAINLTDTNNNSDYQIKNGNGDFNIKDVTNNANRISINSSGTVTVAQHMDIGAGLDVTGSINATTDITLASTTSGQSIFVKKDGTEAVKIGHIGTGNEGFIALKDGGTDTIVLHGDAPSGVSYFNAGNVAIGKTTASEKLDVSGNIAVSGTTTSGYLTLSAVNPTITFTDTNNNPDFKLEANSGQFKIIDSTNSADRLVVNTDGHVDIAGNLDVGAGIDVTGNVVASGDITANGGDIEISGTEAKLKLTDTNNNPDYILWNNAGTFRIYDNTNSTSRLTIGTDGQVTSSGSVQVEGDLDVVADIRHVGDTNTRISFGSDTIDLKTGGSSRLQANNNGITSDQVFTFTTSTAFPVDINNSSDAKIRLRGSSNPYIQLTEGSTNRAYIQWVSSLDALLIVNEQSGEQLRLGSGNNGLEYHVDNSSKTVWHSGNDGAGSGLDADTLDGIESSQFARQLADGCITENSQTISNNYTMTTNKSGMSVGDITVASGVTVTIPSGSRYVIL